VSLPCGNDKDGNAMSIFLINNSLINILLNNKVPDSTNLWYYFIYLILLNKLFVYVNKILKA